MTTTTFRRILAALTLVAAAAAPAGAQTADQLFDDTVLHDIRLRMNTRDLALLRERYKENTFYVADFIWQGTRVRNVAVRSRGLGSRNPTKLGLLVDFDRYVGGRKVAGQKSLVLDNIFQDKSMLREKLALSMFARMGMAAPRNSFARFYINDVYQGVYAIVEAIEEPFLDRTIGESGGYLFEFHWKSDFRAQYLGDDLNAYKPLFEPRTREREADTLLYGPIEDMFQRINAPFDGAWRGQVETFLDLPHLIRQAAVENFMADNDGLAGYSGMNNFYLYRPASSTVHRTFPWDKDQAGQQHDYFLLQELGEYALFTRALQFDDLAAAYYDTLLEAAEIASEDGWMLAEVERIAALIRPAAYEDTRKQFTNEEFEEDVEFLRQFAMNRAAYVRTQVGELRGSGGR